MIQQAILTVHWFSDLVSLLINNIQHHRMHNHNYIPPPFVHVLTVISQETDLHREGQKSPPLQASNYSYCTICQILTFPMDLLLKWYAITSQASSQDISEQTLDRFCTEDFTLAVALLEVILLAYKLYELSSTL